jgi:hypothetical protein
MKSISILALFAAAIYTLNGCASTDTATTSTSGEMVPGETKSTEESRLQPGVGGGAGPNATVKW